MNPNSRLTILYHDNVNFFDYSLAMQDFTKDTKALMLAAARSLYVGFYKPINKFYMDWTDPKGLSTMTWAYYDGTQFIPIPNVSDYTLGLTRSGNVEWVSPTDEQKTTINGIELYWYKINTGNSQATSILNGISVLFSDDQDLAEQIPEINDTAHLAGKTSHVLAHISARNWIIQDLRNKNYSKRDSLGVLQDITVWDLLDIDQINQAATFKALSIIYFNFSDEPNDIYERKSLIFSKKAKKSMELARLKLDFNDDGLKNDAENDIEFKTRRVTR